MLDSNEITKILSTGCYFMQIGRFKDAVDHFKNYISKVDKTSIDINYVLALQNIGVCLKKQGLYDEALTYYEMALNISKKNNFIENWADNLSNIAVVHKNLGLQSLEQKDQKKANKYFKFAEKSYKEVLKLDRQINNLKGVAYDLLNLGIVYINLNERTKAIGAFNESIKIAGELQLYHIVGNAQGGIGKVNLYAGNIDEAISFYKKSIDTLNKTDDIFSYAVSNGLLGSIYYDKNDFENAKAYLATCIGLFKKMNIESPEFKKFNKLYDEIANK